MSRPGGTRAAPRATIRRDQDTIPMATSLVSSISEPDGEFTTVEGEEFYRISAYHHLPPS